MLRIHQTQGCCPASSVLRLPCCAFRAAPSVLRQQMQSSHRDVDGLRRGPVSILQTLISHIRVAHEYHRSSSIMQRTVGHVEGLQRRRVAVLFEAGRPHHHDLVALVDEGPRRRVDLALPAAVASGRGIKNGWHDSCTKTTETIVSPSLMKVPHGDLMWHCPLQRMQNSL